MVESGGKRTKGRVSSSTVPKSVGSTRDSNPLVDEEHSFHSDKSDRLREERIEEASKRSKDKNAKILERLAKL